MLTVEQQRGHAETYRSHPLSIAPDGAFSIVALIWRPGQVTPVLSIHIYGTDVSRIGSSVRRYYELPVRPADERPGAGSAA